MRPNEITTLDAGGGICLHMGRRGLVSSPMNMAKRAHNNNQKQHPLIGSWVNGDEYATDVEYMVSGAEPVFKVRAVDRYDSEQRDVRDVSYEDETSTLSFTVYWNSTGRLVKVRMVALSPNRVSYTYTFTENQMWTRKSTKPNAVTNRRPARRQPNRKARDRRRSRGLNVHRSAANGPKTD
jgi:hypothetical protein